MGDDQIGAKNTESDGLTSQGERTPRSRMWIPSSSRSPGAFPPFLFPFLGDLWCYISFPLVHLPPTLVSHPCPYLSARPIDYSFWRSVSCCGPHHTVQGSRPHKWGQGVSCGYLIRRWQLLLGLLFYHASMADPLGLESPLGSLRGLPLATWRFPLLWFWSAKDRVVLDSISWQSRFPSFILGHFFLLGMGLEFDMKWVGVSRPFGLTTITLHYEIIYPVNYLFILLIYFKE